jgi:hypothetical protein
MWYAASRYAGGGGSSDGFSMPTVNGGVTNGDTSRGSPAFYATTGNLNAQTSYIHHGLDGGAWSGHGALNDRAQGFSAIVPLLGLLPNTWNGETVLLPFPIYIARSSGNKMSLVGNLKHLRHCRINFHNPGDIITLGSDQWKVYPWYRKNVSTPGSSGVSDSHSGTVGFAVRYTGA